MKLTREIMSDKIKLLSVTGIVNERTTDSAIPQSMFDQLLAMGLEHPGAWFATDCKTILPKLHHVGEAYVAFLDHRSQGNGECFSTLFVNHESPEDKCFYAALRDSEDLYSSLNAGTADYNELFYCFDQGWNRGRSILKTDILNYLDSIITPEQLEVIRSMPI